MNRFLGILVAAAMMVPPKVQIPLVNDWHPAGDTVPQLTEVEGISVSTVIAAELTAMLAAAREEGLPVYLAAGYRDYDSLYYIFQREQILGTSYRDTVMTVGVPGYSEYQTGLCADITDVYRERKTAELADTDTLRWLYEHCCEYGFILRWPEGKSDITGMDYVPWHFRYVGQAAAKEITENGSTLEEYLESVAVR